MIRNQGAHYDISKVLKNDGDPLSPSCRPMDTDRLLAIGPLIYVAYLMLE